MNPIVRYYLHQASRGYRGTNIGPIYSVPHFVQRGDGIYSVLTGLWCWIKPILWSGAKTLGPESVRTEGKILADLAQNTNSDVTPRDILSKYLSESTQNLIGKVLSGRGRKRKRNTTTARTNQKKKQKKKKKVQPANKRDIFS